MSIYSQKLSKLVGCLAFIFLTSCASFNQHSLLGTEDIASLSTIIGQHPRDAKAYNMRAIIYASTKRQALAIADFTKAIQLRPNYYQAYANLGLVYYNNHQIQAAYEAYSQALRINPTYDQALIGLGNIFRINKQLDLAIRAYQKAIKSNSTDSAAWYYLGTIRQAQQKYEESIALLGSAISHAPDNFQIYNARGLSYLALGQLDNALDDFQAVQRLKPNNAQSLASIGAVYELQHNNKQARKYYEQALQISPMLRTAINGLQRLSVN